MKIALITGVTGQDGSYLAELLLEKGYKVVGIKRRTSIISTSRIDHLIQDPNFILEYGNMNDSGCMHRTLMKYKPDEVYNLAAQSHVRVSFETPEETADFVAMGTLRLLEAVRNICPQAKFYQASSSEMFGDNPEYPQSEMTRLMPASPYACAKVFAHNICRNYRESYEMHISSGILFNHESPRRGETFVTRKIVRGLSRISVGQQNVLYLGNLDAKRDWGHAKDYVKAMWLMLQQDHPDDYVIATGKQYSVREFVEKVAPYFGMTIEWYGSGDDEIGIDKNTKKTIVAVNSKYYRPSEVETLLGDPSKAKEELGWEPEISFDQLVEDMCVYGQ